MGGEGVVAGRDSCGSLCPPQEGKLEKKPTHQFPIEKKIGVGAGSSELVIR